MRVSWVSRQVVLILLVGVVLVLVSGFLELTSAVQQAARQARVEADLVAGSVVRELSRIGSEPGPHPIEALGQNPWLRSALEDAAVPAPSVLHVVLLSPGGIVVAHPQASHIGAIEPADLPLPEPRTVPESVRTLWELWRHLPTYQTETALSVGGEPYATIRVSIEGAFLRSAVRSAASRGLLTALIVVSIAAATGVLLSRVMRGRFRAIEAGIEALSEGQFQALPESGLDEFDRLAHGLNALGERWTREIRQRTAETPALGSEGQADRAVLEGQSRALARLGEVAAGVAHEMRNQLQTIELDLEVIQHSNGTDPTLARRHAESAARGFADLDDAVRGFLKIARLRPPAMRRTDINRLLEETGRALSLEAMTAGVKLELDLAPDLPEAWVDPEILRRALLNLMRNSLEAMAGGVGERIVVRSTRTGGSLRLTLADDGPGMPPEIRERAFDAFRTTKAEGTGIGLAVVRQSIEMHGGRVWIEPAEERGTTVVLEVPGRWDEHA